MSRAIGVMAFACLGTLAVVTACNAISGLDADYGLAPAPGPEIVDGGREGSRESPADPRPSDAGSVDGSTDSSTHIDAGAWCPAAASWCEDWDDHTSAGDPRSDRDEIAGGTLTVEAGQGIDGSRALHVHVDDLAVSRRVARWRALGTSFPPGARYWLTFAFRVASIDVDYGVIGALQANGTAQGSSEYGLAAYEGCPGACLDETAPGGAGLHPFFGQVAYTLGEWHRAEVVVERTGVVYAGTVKVDGKAVDTNGLTAFGNPDEPSLVDVGVGLFFTSKDNGTADVYIDEVAAGRD